MDIIKDGRTKSVFGCDSVVRLSQDREKGKIRLLQITDMQIIDSAQRRTPDTENIWIRQVFYRCRYGSDQGSDAVRFLFYAQCEAKYM